MDNFDMELHRASFWRYDDTPANFKLLVESKGDSLLTLDAFKEMLELQLSITYMMENAPLREDGKDSNYCLHFNPASK